MNIISNKDPNPKFYAGFSSREASPVWTPNRWAAMQLTDDEARACQRQLQLLGIDSDIIGTIHLNLETERL